jgi:hypothetical protein
MKKSATALQVGIHKHGHLRRRPLAAGLVARFPGGAVAYTQITRDEHNTTRMAYKVAEVYCKYATCTWTQVWSGSHWVCDHSPFVSSASSQHLCVNWLSTLLHTRRTSLVLKRSSTLNPFSTAKYSTPGTKLKLQTRRYIAVLESWAVVVDSRTSATLLDCSWSVDFSSFVLLFMIAASQADALSSMLCFFAPS